MQSSLLDTMLGKIFFTIRSLGCQRCRGTWILSLLAGFCVNFIAIHAYADFQAVETFENLALGTINGQNDWVASPASGEVTLDPSDNSNQVLKVSTESGRLYKAASIAEGAKRMLFLRFRYQEHGRFSFGFSHLATPFEYSDFGPELGMAADSAGIPKNTFRVANSFSLTGIYDDVTLLSAGIWYNMWVFTDTLADTYQVWINSSPHENAQASDQLTNSVGKNLFGFFTNLI